MKRYEKQTTTIDVWTGTTCDGCKQSFPADEYLTEVIISVGEGEEGGNLDMYDYCDTCLDIWAPLLKAAGSRAPLVTGEDLPPEQDNP